MPYDGTTHHTFNPAKALELADILEDESRWPEGFEWNFAECEKCALGLADILGIAHGAVHNYTVIVRAGITENLEDAMTIFGSPWIYNKRWTEITPSDVASVLRGYVSEKRYISEKT